LTNRIECFISDNTAPRNRKADRLKLTGTQKHTQKHKCYNVINVTNVKLVHLIHFVT